MNSFRANSILPNSFAFIIPAAHIAPGTIFDSLLRSIIKNINKHNFIIIVKNIIVDTKKLFFSKVYCFCVVELKSQCCKMLIVIIKLIVVKINNIDSTNSKTIISLDKNIDITNYTIFRGYFIFLLTVRYNVLHENR
ncbi:hypothetical protein MNB_ARC-1_1065 [hydrothermal vent metagenome]|uniref:Uncharacterized protein n=1 Tax=hydrothermal vent metagenome TaxID=652676 RepID=A0A3B1EA41_9ZZZZ